MVDVKAAAEKGSAEAQYKLGLTYRKGDGVTQDVAEAIKWFQKAAEQGLADAQHDLGFIHAYGLGVPQNFAEGLKWYRKAAEQNHAAAQLYMGVECLEGAEANQNSGEAMKWFRKAADQNLAEAKFYVGMLYLVGAGVPRDLPESVRWLHQAAEQGDVRSQCRLGVIYSSGEDLPKEVERGAMYLNLAATGMARFPEAEEAIDALDNLEKTMSPEQITAARTKAAQWARKTADQGNPEAQYSLGFMYTNGRGLPKDPVLAHLYMTLALKSGEVPEAQSRLKALEKIMKPDQVEASRALADKWKPGAAGK